MAIDKGPDLNAKGYVALVYPGHVNGYHADDEYMVQLKAMKDDFQSYTRSQENSLGVYQVSERRWVSVNWATVNALEYTNPVA